MGRRLRTHLDLMKPDISSRVIHNQSRQKANHDNSIKERSLHVSQPVFVRNFSSTGSPWLPGTITQKRGALTFSVHLDDGRIVKRHLDHVRLRTTSPPPGSNIGENEYMLLPSPPSTIPGQPVDISVSNNSHEPTLIRRSARVRHPPDRLMQFRNS